MEKKFIFVICSLFLVLGMLFVGEGITGLYSWDRIEDTCTADSDCADSEACCYFYDEDYGVCESFSACGDISRASMEEKQQLSSLNPPSFEVGESALVSRVQAHVEKPLADYNRNSIIVGLLLVIFAVGVYLISDRHVNRLYKRKRSPAGKR